eukprot:147984_1
MIENLSHIQPSQQLKEDLEYIDRESRSSIHSSSDFDPEHELEKDIYTNESTQIFYAFPKDIKPRNLNLNVHRKYNKSNWYHQRNESNDSTASGSPETPHQRSNVTDEQKYKQLFEKKPIIVPNISNGSNISNLTNNEFSHTNIKIFDFCDKLKQVSETPQDVWINIKPTDTSIDVINETLNHIYISNIQLYGTKPEQYKLFYYDEEDEEINYDLGELKRNGTIAKNVDVIAMKYNIKYCEYEIFSPLNNKDSGCILMIEHNRISVKNDFSFVFDTDIINEYRWINKKRLLIENKEQKIESNCDILPVQFCSNVSVLSSDKSMFEITFILGYEKEIKCMDKVYDKKEEEIIYSLSSSIEFIDIGSFKPENYNKLWNPKTIIPKLKQHYNDSYSVKYWAKSVNECAEIVDKIKGLIASE